MADAPMTTILRSAKKLLAELAALAAVLGLVEWVVRGIGNGRVW